MRSFFFAIFSNVNKCNNLSKYPKVLKNNAVNNNVQGKSKDRQINMGMSSTGYNLLMLTGELHNVEWRAQNLMNEELSLATQKDDAYNEYNNALEYKSVQVAFKSQDSAKSTYKDATFENMCTYNADRQTQYTLTDAKTGKIYVDTETKQNYTDYDNDKYSFAWAMLGMAGNSSWAYSADGADNSYIVTAQDVGYNNQSLHEGRLWLSGVEQKVFDDIGEDNLESKVASAYKELKEIDKDDSATKADKQAALENFRAAFYDAYSSQIYDYMRLSKSSEEDATNTNPKADGAKFDSGFPADFPVDEFNYYVQLWEQIQAAGGCIEIDAQNTSGTQGSEWLTNGVQSGSILISFYDKTKKEWKDTSVATSSNENYLQEKADSEKAKKAEAKYNHELDVIEEKEKKIENSLSKLETQRSAIKTEMEQLKTIRNDNIERTFNLFS